MQKILQNLAMIDMLTFCKENKIPTDNTYCLKDGRGFKYSLVRPVEGKTVKAIVSVEFHKYAVPTHIIYKN